MLQSSHKIWFGFSISEELKAAIFLIKKTNCCTPPGTFSGFVKPSRSYSPTNSAKSWFLTAHDSLKSAHKCRITHGPPPCSRRKPNNAKPPPILWFHSRFLSKHVPSCFYVLARSHISGNTFYTTSHSVFQRNASWWSSSNPWIIFKAGHITIYFCHFPA